MQLDSNIVAGFVGGVLGNRFDGRAATPPFHKECWEICCSNEKYVAIAAPRG